MDIMTGNRLASLRKENKMSQDALAEKLGLSRQAISKWERGESSPDTDNLIALAELYGLTLDELLNSQSEPKNEDVTPNTEESPVIVSENENNEAVKELKTTSLYGKLGKTLMKFPFPIIIVILFVLLGILKSIWHPLWIIFLLIPIYYHFAGACYSKTQRGFMMAMPVPELIVLIYLTVGFSIGEWALSAVLFLVIPLYYWSVASLIKKQHTKKDI